MKTSKSRKVQHELGININFRDHRITRLGKGLGIWKSEELFNLGRKMNDLVISGELTR